MQPINILLIEDNPGDARLIQKTLECLPGKPFQLVCAERLSKGLERLSEGGIDVILLDLSLPDSSGIKTLLEVHAMMPEKPIVVLTGLNDDMVANKAVFQGAQDYLIKGQLNEDLLARSMRYAIERKRAENSLRKVMVETEQILSAISVPLIAVDETMVVRKWNSAAEAVFRKKADAVIGRSFSSCAIEWDWKKINGLMDKCRESLEQQKLECMPYKRPEGEGGVLSVSVSPIHGSSGGLDGFLLMLEDLTERKQLESQLNQAQKLESIGQLAAGIAHEINTPTQYIGDNLLFLQESFGDLVDVINKLLEVFDAVQRGSQISQDLIENAKDAIEKADLDYLKEEMPRANEQSLEGVARVGKIVRAMKDFSHPGSVEKTPVNINQAIESTITVARNEWKYVAEMVTDLDPELPSVWCIPGEFNQVILNLITNASHAIKDAVGDGSKGKGAIKVTTRRDGDLVEIRIGDTGAGVPEEIKAKVFDQFFTTKEVGKGTGQGLFLAYSAVVKNHGGSITFESEVGKGTTFIIRLPITTKCLQA